MSINKRDLSGIRIAGMQGEQTLSNKITVEKKKVDPNAFVAPDKVTENWGASAGAGSDYFHAYRTKREFQLGREEEFKQEEIEERDFDEHQAKRSRKNIFQ